MTANKPAVDLDGVLVARMLCRTGEARSLRKLFNMSLGDVAELVDTSAVNVSRWERGLRVPHGPGAARYGRLLDRLSEMTVNA